ncbi:hypothetical protein AltI4_26560 [Alteromonas sp. I4]|nr:hypothetical protein AltI4_26560 [Alteromonas sp. I4]
MTHIINSLEKAEYVSRKVSNQDARRHSIAITEAGRRKVDNMVPKIVDPINQAFSGLSQNEMAQLDALLRKLITSFDNGALSLNNY